MLSTNDIYRKIKEISTRSVNPRPQVLIALIAQELLSLRGQVMPALIYLRDLRLIQFDVADPVNVRLTMLGKAVTR